jgi:uncharacterized protein YdaU (DUF1376 family)
VSFAFMPFYTGDYSRDTPHLSMSEHGAYFKLLMFCWDQKGPAPLDERKLMGICNARSTDEIEAMRRVLVEFFIRMDDGYYNKRMAEEVARADKISANNSAAGKKSAEIRSKVREATRVERALNDRQTTVGTLTPTLTLTTTTTTKKEKTTRAPRASSAPDAPAGVSLQVWNDFQALRRAIRAPITGTVISGIQREAEKASMSLESALRVCCERGWRGFKAAWVEKDRPVEDAALEAIRMMEERDRRAQG